MSVKRLNTVKAMFQFGHISKDKCDMVFDWEKAAQIIKDTRPYIAYAQLEEDWEKETRKIYQGGIPVYSETVHSQKYRPMLVVNSEKPIPCFKMEYDTNGMEPWPTRALNILEGKL